MLHYDSPISLSQVGLARADITPPVGIYHRMWGAALQNRATGVHQPLFAAAMVMQPIHPESADDIFVLLTLDHCLLFAHELNTLRGRITELTGLAQDRVAITFSHTHAAGLMDLGRSDQPGGNLIAPYLSEMARKICQLVADARENLFPATITHARGRCNLARQRDLWDEAAEQYVCGFNPKGQADDTVLVSRVTNAQNEIQAVLVNYACHPTTLAWENTLISPDYVGTMREVVEQGTGARCLFLQGASGDLGPRDGFVGNTETAERNGRQLGHAVLSALEGMPPPRTHMAYTGPVVSGATLGTWSHELMDGQALEERATWQLHRFEVPLPYRQDLPTQDMLRTELAQWSQTEQSATRDGDQPGYRKARAMVERLNRRITRLSDLPPGPNFPMPVSILRIGDARWVFVEGEHYQYLQTQLRSALPRLAIIVTTLTGGSRCSYLPISSAYGKGIYPETVALLAPGCLETLTEHIIAELKTT